MKRKRKTNSKKKNKNRKAKKLSVKLQNNKICRIDVTSMSDNFQWGGGGGAAAIHLMKIRDMLND